MVSGKAFWGQHMWKIIHYFSWQNNPYFENLLWCLTHLLPCEMCRNNLIKKLQKYPIESYSNSGESMLYYTYMFHDLVNKSTKKTSPSFDNVKHYISQLKFNDIIETIWYSIHTLSATVKEDNAYYFKEYLIILANLLPQNYSKIYSDFLRKYPIDSYLRSHSDAFFYGYLFHQHLSKKRLPPYLSMKAYYFSGVGEECKDCKV